MSLFLFPRTCHIEATRKLCSMAFLTFLKGRRDQPTASQSSSNSYRSISRSVLKTIRSALRPVEALLLGLGVPVASLPISSNEVVLVVATASEVLNQVFQKPMPAWFG